MLTILLVDDDAIIRKLGTFAFGKIGQFDVKLAESAAQALEVLETCTPDIVLLDVMMPEVDGKQAFALIRSKFPSQKIIFLTGQELPEQIKELMDLGALAVLKKPFDPKDIAKQVQIIIDQGK